MAVCSECGATLPQEIDEGADVYCTECGTGQHVTDGGQPTLRLTEDGLEVPEEVALSGGVVFRARGVTVDHKPGSQNMEFYPALEKRHLEEEQRGIQNEHLDAYEVAVKQYGHDAKTYRVVIPETDGGEGPRPDPEKMALEELREEYRNRADIGYSDPEDQDRKMALWYELRDRTDVEQPACPECGEGNWGQAPGEPVQCNSCGEYLGENPELRQEIQNAWNEIMHGGEDDTLVTDGGREYALPGDDVWQRLGDSDINIGDVVVDLARGKSLQVVSVATQPAGEHDRVRSDRTAELFDTDADGLVFNCVFLPNQEDGDEAQFKRIQQAKEAMLGGEQA